MSGPRPLSPEVLASLSPVQREAFLEAVHDLEAIGLGSHRTDTNLLLAWRWVAWAREYRRLLDEGRAGEKDEETQWLAAFNLGLPEDGMPRKYRREREKDKKAGAPDTVSVTAPSEAA